MIEGPRASALIEGPERRYTRFALVAVGDDWRVAALRGDLPSDYVPDR